MGITLSDRIRSEFREMPGLKLTTAQACRLWNLNEAICSRVLDELTGEGFLFRTPSGAFIAVPSAVRMAKAALPEDRRTFRCPHCQHLNSMPPAEQIRPATRVRCTGCTRVLTVAMMLA